MGLFRHPRTTQEKRQNQDFREFCRPARRPSNLPDAWEDYFKHQDRCWKNYRKTQYKIKNNKQKRNSFSYSESMAKRDHWHLEHKWCNNEYGRCNNCWKTGAWDKYDRRAERKHQEYVRKLNEEMERFWKNCEIDIFKLK